MSHDFEQYEREYLNRRAKGIKPDTETYSGRMTRINNEQIMSIKKAVTETTLDSWDYVVLEMIRRADMRIPLKIGTMRSSESFLKLFCHGLIAKLDRPLTFDELERIQLFLDSAEYRQYTNRLNKIMTREVNERLKIISEITGVRHPKDVWDLTDSGKKALKARRAEIIMLHDQMTKQYKENRAGFYDDAPSYMWALPMLMLMGLGSSSMMVYMYSISDPSCVIPSGVNHIDLGYAADFGFDGGFDIGGF